jgi:hypothetical protein
MAAMKYIAEVFHESKNVCYGESRHPEVSPLRLLVVRFSHSFGADKLPGPAKESVD